MDRRLFLKSAVTTCGAVIVGVPNLTIGNDSVITPPETRPGELHYHGIKSRGCAIPTYRRNHHDSFPHEPLQ